ncbi:MAG: hypothetical protein ABSH53_13355 [Holophaga sp.]|jgi:hypothetical protein
MDLRRFAFVLCPLLAAAHPAQAATQPPSQAAPMPGSYQSIEATDPGVQEAKEAVQRYLASLRIEEVREAWTQIVAGQNFKLMCRVSGERGPSTWLFVIWHRLDGTWQLDSAYRM